MERFEAAAILADLKTQFEILDDLANMDWIIFTYAKKPPWFILADQDLSESGYVYENGRPLPDRLREKAQERNAQVRELQARLIDTLAALDLVAKVLGE